MNYKSLLKGYEVDVEFPDVSGMEHLHMLMLRSELATYEQVMDVSDKTRLYKADKRLLEQVKAFHQAISLMADLSEWRKGQQITIRHWWWYLDVIAQVNMTFDLSVEPLQPAAPLPNMEHVPA